jgi:catechol 2,3-dioxygenase-like lactoylglutathione lyase family enzyme
VWAEFRIPREGRTQKAARLAGSPGSILARNDCGLLDLTNDGEFVLDCVVGDQYPHGLASITGTKEVFCVHEQQSVFLRSPVKAQLREELSVLEGKIAPDLLVELCDVHPTSGVGDICFITSTPLHEVIRYLNEQKVRIEEGPVEQNGAMGKMRSIYIRDPDKNLLEISNY